jgi:putative colanic acid biosynthesis UDP-glucose lipid carrier transferase
MIRPYERQLAFVARAVDVAWVVGVLWISFQLFGYEWHERNTILALVAAVLFYFSAELCRVYRSWRGESLEFEVASVVGAWSLVVVALLGAGYALKVSGEYSRLAIGTWFLLTPLVLSAWRVAESVVWTNLRVRGYNTRSAAIVGAGEQGKRVAETIQRSPWMGIRLLGMYDDREPAPDRVSKDLPSPLLGKMDDLLERGRSGEVDIVYLTLPVSNQERIVQMLNDLSDTTASVYMVPDMFLFSMFHGEWVQIGPLAGVSVFETPFQGVSGWVKRAEDLLIGFGALALAALPMALIALGIKATSRGPVLFKQTRYGLDARPFTIYKFRTMTVCEDDDDLTQATPNDPRVTRIGATLRRLSLDELPQVFNVLGGSMSLVGPRPHAAAHNEYYRKLISGYMTRHKVRPGITGWAQANGWRGETEDFEKMRARVEYDLWYIRNWSLSLDLRILVMTALRGFRDPNAY